MGRKYQNIGVLCPAKVNLILRVGPLRRDGFHEIESLMLPLNWGDQLDLKVEESRITSIKVVCKELKDLPVESNLVYRAALRFCQDFRRNLKVSIRLHKKVPTGAGLGGGSSDAATVLMLLAEFCSIRSKARLLRIASGLGADVPFFLLKSAAWCTGFGENCEPIKLKKPLHFVLVHSRKHPVPTGWAYKTLDEVRKRNKLKAKLIGKPSWLSDDWEVPELENDFEAIALMRHTRLESVSRALCVSGASAVKMSGSGSSFFGVYADPGAAKAAAKKLRMEGFEAHFCSSLK